MVNPKTEHDINSGHGEAVSALMDGEAEAADWQWLDDEAACRQWQHYHIIRECLRHTASPPISGGMNERSLAILSQRLREVEQDVLENPLSAPPRPMLPPAANQAGFSRFAVAASVAAVAVAAWQLWPQATAPTGLSPSARTEVPASKAVVAPLAAPKPAEMPAAVQPAAVQTNRRSASEAGVPEAQSMPPAAPTAQRM